MNTFVVIHFVVDFNISYSREYGSQITEDGRVVKPWISLSGDDDGKHYILYPDREDTDIWTYSIEMIIDTGKILFFWVPVIFTDFSV